MSAESVLVVALSLTSTSAAGLAVGGARRAAAGEPGRAVRPNRAREGSRVAPVLFANLVLLPALAWGAAHVLSLGAAGVGLVVAAAAPGGSTGPLLAAVAGGDLQVAVRCFFALTTIGTLTALVATFLLAPIGALAAAGAIALVLATSLGPLLAAEAYAQRSPARARDLARPMSRLSLLLLVVTIVVLVVRHAERATPVALAAGTLLVLATSAIGLGVRGDRASRIAIAQVSTVRNVTLALVVLGAVGAAPEATLAVLAYGLAMYVGTGGIAVWTRYARPT